jgi:hypothetical protein
MKLSKLEQRANTSASAAKKAVAARVQLEHRFKTVKAAARSAKLALRSARKALKQARRVAKLAEKAALETLAALAKARKKAKRKASKLSPKKSALMVGAGKKARTGSTARARKPVKRPAPQLSPAATTPVPATSEPAAGEP